MKRNKLNLELVLFRIYIIIMIFEAPIRYFLNIAGLASLIYIKDMIIIVLFVLSLKKIKISKIHLICIVSILISLTVSIMYIDNIRQILFFILKILLIFIVGVVQYKNIIEDFSNNNKFYKVCYVIVVLGIILNYFITFPWEGLTYSFGDDITITASKSWSTGGKKRLSGFSRASYNAAVQIGIFSLIIMENTKNKIRKFGIQLLTILVIWLTTTKGILVGYIIILIIDQLLPKKEMFLKTLITVSAIIMILLPLFSISCDPIFEFLKENLNWETYIKYISSFESRLKSTWPDTFDLISNNGNIIFGYGFGGIGVAATIYDSNNVTPADNMFVYLYGTIGLLSLFFIIWIMFKSYKLKIDFKQEKIIYYILSLIFLYGIVANVFEETMLNIYLGTIFEYLIQKTLDDRKGK